MKYKNNNRFETKLGLFFFVKDYIPGKRIQIERKFKFKRLWEKHEFKLTKFKRKIFDPKTKLGTEKKIYGFNTVKSNYSMMGAHNNVLIVFS